MAVAFCLRIRTQKSKRRRDKIRARPPRALPTIAPVGMVDGAALSLDAGAVAFVVECGIDVIGGENGKEEEKDGDDGEVEPDLEVSDVKDKDEDDAPTEAECEEEDRDAVAVAVNDPFDDPTESTTSKTNLSTVSCELPPKRGSGSFLRMTS